MSNCTHKTKVLIKHENSENALVIVELCTDCATFLITMFYGSFQQIKFEFKLTTFAQLTAVIEPILAKRGLRIVSAADADRITERKQAEEDAKRRILDAENQRDAVGRALDEYLASKSDRD